jgi:hypothetical protein
MVIAAFGFFLAEFPETAQDGTIHEVSPAGKLTDQLAKPDGEKFCVH